MLLCAVTKIYKTLEKKLKEKTQNLIIKTLMNKICFDELQKKKEHFSDGLLTGM